MADHSKPEVSLPDGKLLGLAESGFALLQQLLCQRYTYLSPLIYGFDGKADDKIKTIGTDGKTVYYDAEWLVRKLAAGKSGAEALMAAYLHMVAHCVLGHIWQPPQGKRSVWNQACDLTAETLCKQITQPPDEDSFQDGVTSELLGALSKITPEALVELCQKSRFRKRLNSIAKFVELDNHLYWYPQEKQSGPPSPRSGGQSDWKELLNTAYGMLPSQISEDIRRGMELADFGQRITAAEDNESDYRRLLRKYTQIREQRQEDWDSIDCTWYTLGLELYDNIPLIEYPESTELPTVDDIVIAVDVSGSCGGEVASRFLRETCNIIRDIGIGYNEVNIRIIECDTVIQRETVIHRADDIPDFSVRKVKGFGGTDFCPVFRRIEELKQSGELQKARCLLYLSDGMGAFPQKAPDYDTIFVLSEDSCGMGNIVPSWVQTVHLTKNDLKEEQA